MSMLGNSRNDRIHPHHRSPPMSIPSSVEFNNNSGADLSISYQPSHTRSQPIPIKACTPSPQEIHENAMSEESSSHYDAATWRMYSRISIARRRHYHLSSGAVSLSSQDDSCYHQKEQELDQPIMNRDDINQEDRVEVDNEDIQSPRRTVQPSDATDAEGIFEIDD